MDNRLQDRLNAIDCSNQYISSQDIKANSLEELVSNFSYEFFLNRFSPPCGFFLDCSYGGQTYTLGQCLFRYDTDTQVTIYDFFTSNMQGLSSPPKGIHVLKKRIYGIGTLFFKEFARFCSSHGISCIRLVPDPFTCSADFYAKKKLREGFDRVEVDYDGSLFFYLK